MALTLRRRKPPMVKAELVDDLAFKKAGDALAKAFLTGNAAKMPGTSWSNQGTINNALIARVTQNLASSFGRAPAELEAALAEHGLSWGPPFPPGRPLDPFWGYRRPPRTMDYSVGENVQLVPRWNRISFPTLKAIIDSYYAAQIAVRHLINDVRSLDYQFIPPQNVLEDATEDIAKAEEFMASPDKRQPFRTWLAEWLQDVLRYDAGSLYIRRNEAQEPIALEVISGTTLIPLVDFFGRPPADEDDTNATPEGIWEGDTVPSFVQIIEGLPWVWLTADDIIYQRLNPLPESQYGLAPMEAVLIQANTDIRFQWHFLQYFTEGTIPAGFMEAPPDLSDPIQVQEWQETWDAVMLGDQSKLNQIRWVPGGAKFTEIKPTVFDKEFPLYLMRCTAAAFGVTANDLGFTEDVNRACYSADTQTLTENGWKNYWEIEPTEKIATYNPETRSMEFAVPDALYVYPYEGEMVRFRSRGVDALVTPDHKMWAWRQTMDRSVRPWRKFEAQELETASRFGFVGHVGWDAPEWDEDFVLPAVPSKTHPMAERHIPMDLWLEFLGYMVSEGCVHALSKHGHFNVSISQSLKVNPEKAETIGRCLAALPIKFTVVDTPDGCRNWHVGDKALWTWLEANIGRMSRGKRLPAFVRHLGKRQLTILLDAMMLGDGTVDTRAAHDRRDYGTMSAQLADDLTEVALKLGYRTQSTCNGIGFWRVSIAHGRDYQLGKRNVTREAYNGNVWCFHVQPHHLFLTRRNGKVLIAGNTGEVQVDVQFRVGTLPVVRFVEDVINQFLLENLKLKARIQFDTGQGTQHRLEVAQANDLYIKNGTLSSDEVRMTLGKRISREIPTPRIMDNTRGGPIPLLAIHSLAGKVDATTYGPAHEQQFIDHPFISAPGTLPVIGSQDYKDAQNSTAQMQTNMALENADPRSAQQFRPAQQPPMITKPATGDGPTQPKNAQKDALGEAYEVIDALLDRLGVSKDGTGIDNTGGPGVTRGFSNPTTVTGGLMVDTGIQGVDLIGPKLKKDPEDEDEEVEKVLRQWRENSLNRIRKGLPPRRFEDAPFRVADPIWERLQAARTREEVIAAFSRPLGKVVAPTGA